MAPASRRYCLLFSLILLSLSCLDETRAIRHFTEVHVSDSEPPLYDREVLYTVADAPGFGSNRSEIEIDIDFVHVYAYRSRAALIVVLVRRDDNLR